MVLRNGSHGSDVAELQHKLNMAGAKLVADGWFGDATEAAVIAFQRRTGLVADGIAGGKTLATLASGARPPKLLTDADLAAAAERLGVPVAVIRAVNAVESRGSGFLVDGRPVILFERHVFYRQLEAAGIDAAALAARYPNLCNRQRGGYAGGAAEWMRIKNAAAVSGHFSAAYESASWGLFQILGYHWSSLGYDSVDAFVAAMYESEGRQLEAFIRFIEADPALAKALKAKKWAEFARLYNGPAYKDNLYDVKLARAFDRFERLAE